MVGIQPLFLVIFVRKRNFLIEGAIIIVFFFLSRFPGKTSGAPAQLTIFYGGAVNIFDDITPEKVHSLSLF